LRGVCDGKNVFKIFVFPGFGSDREIVIHIRPLLPLVRCSADCPKRTTRVRCRNGCWHKVNSYIDESRPNSLREPSFQLILSFRILMLGPSH
jgi:hypothetical protein